jgi:hypothetical protein
VFNAAAAPAPADQMPASVDPGAAARHEVSGTREQHNIVIPAAAIVMSVTLLQYR